MGFKVSGLRNGFILEDTMDDSYFPLGFQGCKFSLHKVFQLGSCCVTFYRDLKEIAKVRSMWQLVMFYDMNVVFLMLLSWASTQLCVTTLSSFNITIIAIYKCYQCMWCNFVKLVGSLINFKPTIFWKRINIRIPIFSN